MKARMLLGSATFAPETLKTVYKAFDAAWERISPGVANPPEAVEAARMKLAEAVIVTARELDEFDAAGLADIALTKMHAEPAELGVGKTTDQLAKQR